MRFMPEKNLGLGLVEALVPYESLGSTPPNRASREAVIITWFKIERRRYHGAS